MLGFAVRVHDVVGAVGMDLGHGADVAREAALHGGVYFVPERRHELVIVVEVGARFHGGGLLIIRVRGIVFVHD